MSIFRRFIAFVLILMTSFSGVVSVALAKDNLFWVYDKEIEPVSREVSEWEGRKGDYLLVAVDDHIAYLVREDGYNYYSFPVLTGQRRWLYYIGRSYFGATPIDDWELKSYHSKSNRVYFGESGRFLRLYRDGRATAYGVHPYKYFERDIENGKGYISFGCILISEGTMDFIMDSWEMNDEILKIKTVSRVSDFEGFQL